MVMRPSGRAPDVLRPVSLAPGVAKYAEGSFLARFGYTHVLCTASVEERVPPFLRNTGRGWVTAEYGMLPRSTAPRTDREAARRPAAARARTAVLANGGSDAPYALLPNSAGSANARSASIAMSCRRMAV